MWIWIFGFGFCYCRRSTYSTIAPKSMHTPTRMRILLCGRGGGNSNFNQMRPILILVPFGTHADHKVLYHLPKLGDIYPPIPLSIPNPRNNPFDPSKSNQRPGQKGCNYCQNQIKFSLPYGRTLSACGHRLLGPGLRILVRTWRLFRFGSPGHNVLLMTSSAPAVPAAVAVVVDDAYCVSHKKQAEKNQAWEIICRLATLLIPYFQKNSHTTYFTGCSLPKLKNELVSLHKYR